MHNRAVHVSLNVVFKPLDCRFQSHMTTLTSWHACVGILTGTPWKCSARSCLTLFPIVTKSFYSSLVLEMPLVVGHERVRARTAQEQHRLFHQLPCQIKFFSTISRRC